MRGECVVRREAVEPPDSARYRFTVTESERRERAAERRRRMLVKRVSIYERDDIAELRGGAAVSLAARLSREHFELAGRELPTYERSSIPVAFVPYDDK